MRKSRLTRSFATGRITVTLATDAEHLTDCDVDGPLMDFWSSLVENLVIPQINHLSADSYPLPANGDEVTTTEYKQGTEATLNGGETLRVKIKLVSKHGIKRSTLAYLVSHLLAEVHVTLSDIEDYQAKVKAQAFTKKSTAFGANTSWNPPGFSDFADMDLSVVGFGQYPSSNYGGNGKGSFSTVVTDGMSSDNPLRDKSSTLANLAGAIFGDNVRYQRITDPEEIRRILAQFGMSDLADVFGSGFPGSRRGNQG